MEKGVKKENTAGLTICKSFRLHLPQGRTTDITVKDSTPIDCYMAVLRWAVAQYPGWRSIEVIPSSHVPQDTILSDSR
ncbi:hypothetical protein [Dysgonomonas sp. HGC4]|uniref:hypothetical protein n=1 Tax=Dysgonomonas sp. HGC4 TaxID=1658009 RepID=UPI000681C80B|nr:hypothetical protein [Dysgonomonas sp. HGC4]MBD8347881.1 hypothetical protein [Dysgonomonas sp. HGC4]